MLNIQLLLTGNELMSGDIVDTNSVFIAQELKNVGVELARKVTVGDHLDMLVSELESLSQQADVLIVNGGLGPTIDDMTAQALAKLINKPLQLNPIALEQLQAWCDKRNYQMSEPNKKQAILPQGCDIVYNPLGSAPGFSVRHNDCKIICTPGVPSELKAMFFDSILLSISKRLPTALHTVTQKLQVFGIGESGIQKMVNEAFPNWPADIELGFRASMPVLEIKLTSRQTTSHELRQTWYDNIKTLLGQHIVCEGTGTIASTLVEVLSKRNKTMTTIESCTGGLMASLLTNVSGSSAVFEAGFVTYSNAMKTKLVDVPTDLLETHGAVSQAVVEAMLKGGLKVSSADYGIAVSGIAGPTGGTEEKPLGTVWLAWGSKDKVFSQELYFPSERVYFQRFIAAAGLDLVRRLVLNFTDTPRYITERQRKS